MVVAQLKRLGLNNTEICCWISKTDVAFFPPLISLADFDFHRLKNRAACFLFAY